MDATCLRVVALLALLWAGVFAQYDLCTGNTSSIEDGRCDDDNNNADCGYDGGDCCYCSCLDDYEFSCGAVGFDCLDPEYVGGEVFDCTGAITVDGTCSTDFPTHFVVNDTASADTLGDAIRCSGGVFTVAWLGSVSVSRTIKVTNGTVLHVAGVRPGATVQAVSGVRLFTVINASLKLTDIAVAGGYATFGGAIAAAGSYLSFENASFVGNGAAFEGGVLYATLGSVASFGEVNIFYDNHAGVKGGALNFGGASSVTFHGYTSFSNCTTNGYGGALFVSFSTVSWTGEAMFFDNTADVTGGALFAFSSNVSWSGDAVFSNNTVGGWGGALSVYSSNMCWSGNGVFSHNTADLIGGALLVFSSNVSWSGDLIFSHNTADGFGGALSVISSTTSWSGNAVFSDNIANAVGGLGDAVSVFSSDLSWSDGPIFPPLAADGSGGALYVFSSDVSWSGDFVFWNNTAGGSGGALYVFSSTMFWSGDPIFSYNAANEHGGALEVCSSSVSWLGDPTFSNNTANVDGGALRALTSTLSWSGDPVFSDNTANSDGGALDVHFATMSWSGDPKFSHNTANIDGGALDISHSIMSWSGDPIFSHNSAVGSGDGPDGAGGALDVFRSDISWSGDPMFSHNTANIGGGALYVFESDVSWSGDAVFFKNTADGSGGALYVSSSDMSWLGNAVFSNNTANEHGGALHILSSTVSWSGDTEISNTSVNGNASAPETQDSDPLWRTRASFINNAAGGNGGALCIIDGARVFLDMDVVFLRNSASGDAGAVFVYSISDAKVSSLCVHSTTAFQTNLCGGDGGALAVVAAGEVTFATTNVTFSHNSAHAAGGAVAVKGLGVGPQFQGLTFVSNHAQIGGAAYITSSGTAITEDPSGVSTQHPTTFNRCKFTGNKAEATGGAIETRAGLDEISNTIFASNMARAGGAMKLAGITSLHDCTFTENLSDNGEGSAVVNSGSMTSIAECSFVDNAFNCEEGEFLDYPETNSNVVFDVVCKKCGKCDGCTTSALVPACSKELEHTESLGGSRTIEELEIDRGYWRATNTSWKVLKCYNADACEGGITGAEDYCSPGYQGPYCSTCLDGYSPSLGYTCSKCSGGISSVIVEIIVAIAAIFVVVLLLFCPMCWVSTGAWGRLMASWTRKVLSLKIVVIVWQITTQFASMTNVRYPDVYQRFLDGINTLNFDLSRVVSVGCIIDLDFHHGLCISTLGPAAALIIIGVVYAVNRRIHRSSHYDCEVAVQPEDNQRYISMVLLLTFLVYSSVSSTLFRMFACDELDDGKSYLRADYRIDCDSSTHRYLQVYAACMMVVYTAGIPVLYGILLFRNRQVLIDRRTREEDAVAKSISSLWKLYKPNRFYYDLIECARRILLAGVVVFIFPNTAAQLGIALVIAAIFMVFSEMVAPYESLWSAWINRIGHAIVFGTIYLALLLKIDIAHEREEGQRVFGAILIGVQLCMVFLVTCEAIVVTCQWKREPSSLEAGVSSFT